MKIGDKVRFLSEIGGGRVSGFQGKNIVLVEDADGFEIPMQTTDVVVVESDDYSTAKTLAAKKAAQQGEPMPEGMSIKQMLSHNLNTETTETQDETDYDPSEREITFRPPIEERKGGNKLSAYLAFVPLTPKEFTTTRFECYLVNDSNYFLHYTLATGESSNFQLRFSGEIEPNTKFFIEEIGREDLNNLQHISIQMLAYKREKFYILKPAIDVQLRPDAVKFYKLHCFEENDFFEQPALMLTIIENDEQPRPFVIDAKKLKKELYSKAKADEPKPAKQVEKKGKDEIVVVDLHASEILETTTGLTNTDILEYQLKVFRETLAEYANRRGQKIVFIHGKGEGVLRRALINDLNYRFKRYQYQDASFQEYGYGATQVTIR